jgi:hypothetical protein
VSLLPDEPLAQVNIPARWPKQDWSDFLTELARHLADKRHERQPHPADAAGDLPAAGSRKRETGCPKRSSKARSRAPVDPRAKWAGRAVESLAANSEKFGRNVDPPPGELHPDRAIRTDEARVGKDHPVWPERGKQPPVSVPVWACRCSRWMPAVRKRHPTRRARRRTLAGADEKDCAKTDPDKDGVTVSHSHHLQLYRRPARIVAVSG